MFRRSPIVWKLNAVFIPILLLVFVISGYINNLLDEHHALASASDLYRLNSATLHQSIKTLLMTRDTDNIKQEIDQLAESNPLYREIRLVSHGGEIMASRVDPKEKKLEQESRSCQVCHALADPLDSAVVPHHDEIVKLPDGTRAVSVLTPLLNEPACSSADCHAHANASPVLGFLEMNYSLSQVDALTSARNLQTVLAVLVATFLVTISTWLMVGRFLARPIAILISGMRRIARGDLGFRFTVRRSDEFATVAETFNEMTSRLESSLSELRETRDYLEGIVENSADIIITVNPAGLIQTFNRGAESVLGYERSEVIGKRIEMLFADPQERDVAIARLQRSDNVVNFETRFLTRTGDVRNVLLTLSRLRRPDGEPIGTFGISKDLTTEKKLQRQLIQSERFTAIGQSFTGIQHAMKNMLNALKGGSYMVKTGIKKNDQEMLAEGWQMVEEGISDITELSRNMLKYMRDWEPEFKQVPVGEIIEKIDGVIARTASGKGVAFRTQVPPGLPEIRCDPGLIHSAILDIVSNALEACLSKEYGEGESPRIDLTTANLPSTAKVLIEVRDNGIGMTRQVKANIFTPFFSTKRNKGTGLGLALTSRIVSLHGGTIEVLSEPGRGSAFHVLLPAAGPNKNKEDRRGKESARDR